MRQFEKEHCTKLKVSKFDIGSIQIEVAVVIDHTWDLYPRKISSVESRKFKQSSSPAELFFLSGGEGQCISYVEVLYTLGVHAYPPLSWHWIKKVCLNKKGPVNVYVVRILRICSWEEIASIDGTLGSALEATAAGDGCFFYFNRVLFCSIGLFCHKCLEWSRSVAGFFISIYN